MFSNSSNAQEDEEISFEPIFEDRPIKTLSVLISIFGALFTVPLIYGIIWFEENNHFRTLINQLVASICWYLICFILLIQLSSVILYIHGPLGSFFCGLDLVLRNVMSMQAIFLLEAIVITKYVFVHLLKNPVAIHDDFLRLFINLSTVTISLISQAVYITMPGRNPMPYYICIGSFPISKVPLHTPVKVNIPVFALLAFSSCTHLYTAIKMKQSVKKEPKKEVVKIERKTVFNVLTDKHMLASFTSNVFSMGLLIIGSIITFTFNKIQPHDLNRLYL
jgi:hypothetical protein